MPSHNRSNPRKPWLKMSRRLRTAAAAAIAIAIPVVSPAQVTDDFNTPVKKGSALTFKELVSHIFKDVREDGASGNLVTSSEKALRRIGTRERTVLPAETPLTDFDSIRVRGDGRRYLILMIGAETEATEVPGGGAAIVAVFPEGSAEPQDMAEVKADRLCFFGETRLGLGPDDAFTIVNHHSNSNQAYLITELYRIQGGRFQLIDSVFTLSATGLCENSLQEVLTWQTEPDGASSHPKIVAAVSVRQGPGEDETPECLERGIKPRKLTFSETYRWDKAKNRYSRGGNGFEALDRLNEKNL